MKKILLTFPLVMGAVFYLTFVALGPRLNALLKGSIDWWTDRFSAVLTLCHVSPTVHALLIDGACAGIGSVLSFLPTIGILFFCLSLLDTSGYLDQLAAAVHQPMTRLGLTGQSLILLLTGFGCTTAAITAAGRLNDRRSRCLTVAAIPFMSCSAKIPVYVLIVAGVFPACGGPLILGLYLVGAALGLLTAALLHRFFPASTFPPAGKLSKAGTYDGLHAPDLHAAFTYALTEIRAFSQKAFTFVFLASVLVWGMENFTPTLHLTTSPQTSLLAACGRLTAPLFSPLGLDDWRAVSALLSGLFAKEAIISTLTVMEAPPATIFTPQTALPFLLFVLLYMPCLAALNAIAKTIGGLRYAILAALFQTGVAWLVAFVVYRFTCLWYLL